MTVSSIALLSLLLAQSLVVAEVARIAMVWEETQVGRRKSIL